MRGGWGHTWTSGGAKTSMFVHTVRVSGMLEDGSDGLHISDAFHKAFLEVRDITQSSSLIGLN